jgi:signal transduction histidine kinase
VDFLLQLDQKDPKLQKEVLLDISAETQRLSRLVKELLTLAKADSGLKLNLTELKIAPVLEEVVRQARFLEKGQNFILSLEAAEGVVLRVDPDYFKQMLYIFLDNGFKYTPPGQSFSFQVKREGEELGLIFQDEGPGIPEKDLPHIFERFYRSEASRTGEGAGLGLAIAKWIIEQHGGKIKVESEENKGTTFFITFPMHQQK